MALQSVCGIFVVGLYGGVVESGDRGQYRHLEVVDGEYRRRLDLGPLYNPVTGEVTELGSSIDAVTIGDSVAVRVRADARTFTRDGQVKAFPTFRALEINGS